MFAAHARYGYPGYIGGSALAHLIQHPKRAEHEITIHLRSAEKAKVFEKLGFKTVLGSLDDVVDLEKFAAESDIVFQTVSPLTPVMYRQLTRCYRPTLTTSKGPKPF